MLGESRVEATVPTTDLARAREFYEGRLGLRKAGEESAGVDVVYACGGATSLLVYERGPGAPPPAHTVAHFVVEDVEATMRGLRDRGVAFEDYDLPELRTENGIATSDGHHFAWFKDPDGNVLGIHDGMSHSNGSPEGLLPQPQIAVRRTRSSARASRPGLS
jgi:catechol 2,3-dioxygenase-like lactoylglutathione lyase family enzyme